MKHRNALWTLLATGCLLAACEGKKSQQANKGILLKNVTLIDGHGNAPLPHMNILIQGDTIAATGENLDTTGVQVIDATGKTVLPALISGHVHIGNLKGTTSKGENYTRDNILAQLNKYQNYGVLRLLSMGSDRPFLFQSGIRDSSITGLLPGARIHSAGYGFGVPDAAPPVAFGMDQVFRPATAAQVPAQMDSLAAIKADVVKMWLDDFGGKYHKMEPAVYKAIITEAHKRHMRVVAHAYYAADVRDLVLNGIDVIGHSIRDTVISDELVALMKEKQVTYIPTLSLDEYAYVYARKPEWVDDPFFKASLEPGVYEMITSEKYQNDIKNAPNYGKNMKAFETALKNLKKLFDAGVLVVLGTDSGASPVRVQGFSEHLELELMTQAGLTPLQAITVATKNAATFLKVATQYGTVEKGRIADLLIVEGDPSSDIKNTRKIVAVYKAGREVSKGPLQ